MNIFAILLGAMIGLLVWSRLTHLSYAIHDVATKVNLATKLGDPNSGIVAKLIWCVVAASFIWLLLFGTLCLRFSHVDPSKYVFAWFFGGVTITPIFIAYTTTRALRRFNKRKVERAQL